MGLSSKQVSNRGLDWNHALLQAQNLELPKVPPMRKEQQEHLQENQKLEAVYCPRCDSTNTKFCYYNNYNKSQPRHFCRACKRHWTKGGTLRNVPVGGGRKNKRSVKKSISPKSPTNSISTTSNANNNMTSQTSHQQSQNLPTLAVGDHQKSLPASSLLYQSMIRHPSSLLPQQNLMSTRESEGKKDFGIGNGIFLSSTMPFPQNQSNLFPFSNSTSFDKNTCVVSTTSLMKPSGVYNYVEEFKIMEEPSPTMNSTLMPNTSTQPWEMPAAPTNTTNGLEMSNYWSWEDIDSLVSTDLNAPWNQDSDIKP